MIAVDFAPHPAFAGAPDALRLRIAASRGRVWGGVLQPNPGTGGWRLAFRFDPGGAPVSELCAAVERDGTPVGGVWLCRWTAA